MTHVVAVAGVVLQGWLRRKEGYVLVLLLAGLQYAMASLGGGGDGSALYLFDSGLLLTWLLGWVIAIHAGATELPGEEARGTVFLLLAKPLGRGALIAGKWLGAWIAVVLATLTFYAVALLLAAAAGFVPPAAVLLQACLLHIVSLAVLTALALAVSTRLNRDAAVSVTVALALALYLVLPRVPQFAAYAHGWRTTALDALYYALPHLELFDLRRRVLHGFGPLPADVTAKLVAYGAVWTCALLAAAWLSYRHRRFRRDQLAE